MQRKSKNQRLGKRQRKSKILKFGKKTRNKKTEGKKVHVPYQKRLSLDSESSRVKTKAQSSKNITPTFFV